MPSAGVGTCFSRRAVTALLADGDGIAFDVQSLTEDYDIGFRLKEKGMTEIFVRFPVVDEAKEREQRKFLQHARTSNMICVREYFPIPFRLRFDKNPAGSSALFSKALKPINGPPA